MARTIVWMAAWSALVFSAFAVPARADECGPLKLLTSVDLVPGPGGGRMFVPVSINGVSKRMLLSTAGGRTTLTQAAIELLNLHARDSDNVRLLDSAGNASRRFVHLDSFQIGAMQAKDVDLLVTPDPNAGENIGYDGILAGDLMDIYDVEMDFVAHKLNYFLSDHCPGHVVYWSAPAVAVVPITLVRPARTPEGRGQLQMARDTHIRVPVRLDGKQFTAVVNTGATNSTMSAKTAQYVFGITADSPGSVPLGIAGGDPNQKIFGHVFNSLSFEGVAVTNPHIVIRPDLIGARDPDNDLATGSLVSRVDDNLEPQITIGMDVLRRLHLYVAYGEEKLYVTPAAAPASGPTSPANTPP